MKRLLLSVLFASIIFTSHASIVFAACAAQYSCACDGQSYESISIDSSLDANAASIKCQDACQNDIHGTDRWELACDGNNVNQGEIPSTTTVTTEKPKEYQLPHQTVTIPGLKFTQPYEKDGYLYVPYLAQYVQAIFSLAIVIGSIGVILTIMIAGLKWMTARGNASVTKNAQAEITNAFTSLFILLGVMSVIVLVDPELTQLPNIKIQLVKNIPIESIVDFNDGIAPSGNLKGVSSWQDCMLKEFGEDQSSVESQLTTISCAGQRIQVHTKAEAAFTKACDALAASGYTVKSLGVYNWRANRNNAKALSFHSWGVSIDVNPDTNPNCPAGTTCSYDLSPKAIAAFTNNGFSWGGNWTSLKDYMHFSLNTKCGQGR